MLFDVAVVDSGSRDLESILVTAVALPWTGWYSGVGMPWASRRLRVRPRPFLSDKVDKPTWRWFPDPASDGRSHRKVRTALPWFEFDAEGESVAHPLLASISILRCTRFPFEQLPALKLEIDSVLPHLGGDDELLFDAIAFLTEETIAWGAGAIEFRPGMMG